MKKILLLSFLLVAYSNIFAFLTQSNWRWRNDDGSQTTATWMAPENNAPTINSGENTIRLRLEVYNTLSDTTYLEDTLQYALSASGPWTNITSTAGSHAFVLAGSSPFVSDGEKTTSQLSASVNKPFHPGIINVSHTVLNDSLPPDNRSEYEWCIKPTANIQTNTTYYFQHWGATAQKKSTATYPSLKTAGVLAVHFAAFTVTPDGKTVKLSWTTASEQNNDHFNVERSSDGTTWKVIATVKGNGTTAEAHHYAASDLQPVKGMNYYRIKQFDMNGKAFVSDIRSIKMFVDNNAQLSVYPNPAKSFISFTLKDYSGNVSVTLSNSNGKVIHTETVSNVQPNTNYCLHLKQQPAPGIYFIKVTGDGLLQTAKVVVQ